MAAAQAAGYLSSVPEMELKFLEMFPYQAQLLSQI